MLTDNLKKHCCCFTGHRPEKLSIGEQEAKKRLEKGIEKAISEGYYIYISGMARGIDMWAAEIVLKKREENPKIKLLCAPPFPDFEKYWSEVEKRKYRQILRMSNGVRFVCDSYSKQSYQRRNIFMVDNSGRILAAYTGESGGTRNTVLYAYEKGIEIENILMYEDF